MMRKGFALIVLLLAGSAGLGSAFAAPAEELSAKITYIAGKSIYVDAGAENGVTEKTRFQVVRDGAVIATLTIEFLSARRASCKVVGAGDVQVGDTVQFALAEPVAVVETSTTSGKPARSRYRGRPVRGRVGIQFLTVANNGVGQSDFSQPALSFRLRGYDLGSTGIGVNVDVRARQTSRTLSDGTTDDDSRTRIYRLAAEWQAADSPFRITAGRQVETAAAGISIFDGISASWTWEKWAVGVLSGSQPDPVDFGMSGDVKEHGVYLQYKKRGEDRKRLSFTTGLIGSYEQSEINREYLYFQTLWSTRKLSLYFTEELDINRGWKKEIGESSLDSTSTFISARYRVSDHLDFQAGFDNRRNIRLYRDRTTPETEFDDDYRTGAWGGVGVRFKDHYRVGVRYRTSDGGTRGTSDNLTGTFGIYGLTRRNVAGSFRMTHYSNDVLDGDLLSVSGSLDLTSKIRLGLAGGLRDETDVFNTASKSQTWYGLDLDFRLGKRWYLNASWLTESGDLEEISQLYASLAFRF
jgi:hypothetical protein